MLRFTVTYNPDNGYLYFDHGADDQNRIGIPMNGADDQKLQGLDAIRRHAITAQQDAADVAELREWIETQRTNG